MTNGQEQIHFPKVDFFVKNLDQIGHFVKHDGLSFFEVWRLQDESLVTVFRDHYQQHSGVRVIHNSTTEQCDDEYRLLQIDGQIDFEKIDHLSGKTSVLTDEDITRITRVLGEVMENLNKQWDQTQD